jgi:arylsulfatase
MKHFPPVLSVVTLLLCGLLLPLAAFAAEAPATKPNILFILADDTGYGDLAATGNPILKTPNLDRLYHEGVRLTNFHVSPTCSPTRSALMTGRHEFKNGVTHTILERERLNPDAITIAQMLKAAGYTTGIFGKWHLGDEPDHWPTNRGFDEMFIHGGGGIGQTYPGSCGDAPGNQYFNPAILHNGKFEKTEGFCTDIFTDHAIAWMEQAKNHGPFFCYLPYNAAHAPLSCPPKFKEPYVGKVPEAGDVATYFGMVANIDENVGRLLAKLDEWGIAKNTLVIFMNDNGGYAPACKIYNAGMRGSKGSAWMGGTRAVSLWRWPGALDPHDSAGLSANIDFFPTIAELAGVSLNDKAHAQVEGRSLVPLLRDAHASWPERTLFVHAGRWPKDADVQQYKYSDCSVRRGHWTLVSDSAPGKPRDKGWQLFDLTTDPGEQHDVSAEHPDVVASLDAAYDKWWASVVPMMINEKAVGPKINPFKELYWKQFGGGPTQAELDQMDMSKFRR